ncbi:MAG TPA: hypothetical protein VJ464_13405 [Blastocatellia bacterium]|nr:hypothetical protein [Blastocatellia bacterium]
MPTRKETEARRGIVRDEDGKIVRSKEWLEQRIEVLKAKKTDLQNRIKNIEVEIKARTLELKK